MPRHMTADEWSRMLGLLDVMRPGIVKESPENASKSGPNSADKGDS